MAKKVRVLKVRTGEVWVIHPNMEGKRKPETEEEHVERAVRIAARKFPQVENPEQLPINNILDLIEEAGEFIPGFIARAMDENPAHPGETDDEFCARAFAETIAKNPEMQGLPHQDILEEELPDRSKRYSWRLNNGKVEVDPGIKKPINDGGGRGQ